MVLYMYMNVPVMIIFHSFCYRKKELTCTLKLVLEAYCQQGNMDGATDVHAFVLVINSVVLVKSFCIECLIYNMWDLVFKKGQFPISIKMLNLVSNKNTFSWIPNFIDFLYKMELSVSSELFCRTRSLKIRSHNYSI